MRATISSPRPSYIMKIIIDTREQLPLPFTCETVRECLAVGDYGGKFSDGTSPRVVFERKSIGDLYGTLSQGYERFKREITKAKELETHLIIIVECSLRRVLSGYGNSQRTGLSIVNQLFTLRVRYEVETVFTNNREEMIEYISHMFKSLENEHEDSKHE